MDSSEPQSPVRCTVRLFGGVDVTAGEDVAVRFASRKATELFAYLVLNRRKQSRSTLVGVFWPDIEEAKARRRLSQTLWQIGAGFSEVVGEDATVVEASRDDVELSPDLDVEVDVETFDRLLSAASTDTTGRREQLRRAVALYRGDLLAGNFEDWVLLRQDQLRQRLLDAVADLIRLLKANGELEEALVQARSLTRHAPMREDGHREVMRLSHLLGRPTEAIEQYDLLRSILWDEIGTEPDAETERLFAQISAAPEPAPAPTSEELEDLLAPIVSHELVGRATERAALISRLEELLAGRGGTVLLEGAAGMGKTRLVEQLRADAEWRGIVETSAECQALPAPYAPVRRLLAGVLTRLKVLQIAETVDGVWLREVARLVPSIGEWLPDLPTEVRLEVGEERDRLQAAVVRTLNAVARLTPVLLIVEDLHLADPDSLQVIQAVGEQAGRTPIGLVTTVRPEEARARPDVWAALRSLDIAGRGIRLALEPMEEPDTIALIEASGHRLSPDLAERLHRDAGGNPLFTLETLRAMSESGRDLDGPVELPVADSVRDVLAGRLEQLPDAARSVLEAVAVFGAAVTIERAGRLAEEGLGTVSAGIEDLLAKVMLVEDDDGFDVAHEQLRRIAYEQTGDTVRRHLHLRTGELLQEEDPDAAPALAHHFTLAEEWERAVRAHAVAADQAIALRAPALAADHLESALGPHSADVWTTAERSDLLLDAESVFDVLGRSGQQMAALDELAGLAEGQTALQVEVERRKGIHLAQVGSFDDAVRSAENAVGRAEGSGDDALVSAARHALGRVLGARGKPNDAIAQLELAAAVATDTKAEADARAALGTALGSLQRFEEGAEQLERAIDLYGDDHPRGRAEALRTLAVDYMERGDHDRAELTCFESLEICSSIGYSYGQASTLVNLGNLAFLAAELTEAFDRYSAAAEVFASIGNRLGEAFTLTNVAEARLALFGVDEEAAEAAAEAHLLFEEMDHFLGLAHVCDVEGRLALNAGDVGKALQLFDQAADHAVRCQSEYLQAQVRQSRARAALVDGDLDGALAQVDGAIPHAEELGLEDVVVGLRAVQAGALVRRGEHRAAFGVTDTILSAKPSGIVNAPVVWWLHHQVCEALGRANEAEDALERAHDLLVKVMSGLEEADRQRSLDGVAEHRAIEDAWQSRQPIVMTATVASSDAPTGRRLTPEEYVEITWTMRRPADRDLSTQERRACLIDLVAQAETQGGAPKVEDLASALDVSRATVRRDLAALRAEGRQIRTRGSRDVDAE